MNRILMFVYAFIIVISQIYRGVSFFKPFLNFIIYLIHNVLTTFSKTIFFFFDNADGIPCVFDYNCPEISYYPVRCNVNNICEYNLNVDLVEEIEWVIVQFTLIKINV